MNLNISAYFCNFALYLKNTVMKTSKKSSIVSSAIFVLMFVVSSLTASAQNSVQNKVNFRLNSTRTAYIVPNSTKNYYVFNYEGQSQKELFDKVLAGIYKAKKQYRLLTDGLTKVEWDYISVFTILSEKSVQGYYHGLRLTLEFEFKDGKIRVNVPFLFDREANKNFTLSEFLEINKIINTILSNVNAEEDW